MTEKNDQSSERYARGYARLAEVDGRGGQEVVAALESVAPDLGRYIVEFAFGDIYNRPGLNLQEREMVTLACLLTAGGCEAQLDVHIHAALHVGITAERIIEVFMQCIPYVGFPRVLNAVAVAKRIMSMSLQPTDAKDQS